ncbi:MAG: SPOR domain-containing protein [Salinisphaera sp.]|nr:SPOR domain-containing protein [Salinisphaera sp.]
MARDYAKSGARGAGGRKKRRNRPAKRRTRRTGMPGWLWLFCGLCAGLVVAAGLYVFGRPVDRDQVEIAGVPGGIKVPHDHDQKAENAEEVKKADNPQKPRFAFYEMLPNYEVVVPAEKGGQDEPASAHTAPAHHGAAESAAHSASGHSNAQAPTQDHAPGRYVVQAGSFSTYQDADERKAGLALLGVASRIQEVTLNDGQTYFRVRTLPVSAGERLDHILGVLREHSINALVVSYHGQ